MSLEAANDVHEDINAFYESVNHVENDGAVDSESTNDGGSNLINSTEGDLMPMWKAAVNFICDVEGTGLLSLPYAVLNGGVATLAALIIVPVICCYTGSIMVKCLYGNCWAQVGRPQRLRSSIEELGEACWPGIGRKVVLALQNTELLMLSASYLVLCGTFLDYAFPSLPFTKILWSCVGAAAVLPTVFLKKMSNIAWLSLIGIVSVLVPVGSVMWYGISHSSNWELSSIPQWNPEGIPIAFGIVIFSNAAHSILPRLEGDMANKKNFNVMLIISYIFISCIKIIFSFCAFFSFTSHTKDLVTNNLPGGVVFYVSCIFLGINVLASYPFPVLIVIRSIDDAIPPGSIPDRLPTAFWFVCVRLCMVLFTLGAAVIIPHFGLMLAFVGSLTSAITCFVLPCLFHLKLKRDEIYFYQKILDYCIVIFGVAAGGFGLFFSGKALVIAYENT